MSGTRLPHFSRQRGFTLLELLIALSIVAALLAVAFGGLRVALASWRQGESRAEVHQHVRGLVSVLARAVEGAAPYRGARGEAPENVILFRGTETSLEFVTRVAPYPFALPIAFTAVVIGQGESEGQGLVVKQRALPNRNPFTDAVASLTDPSVSRLTFRYLDATGEWRDSWDGSSEQEIPQAIEISLLANLEGRTLSLPPLTVAVRTTKP